MLIKACMQKTSISWKCNFLTKKSHFWKVRGGKNRVLGCLGGILWGSWGSFSAHLGALGPLFWLLERLPRPSSKKTLIFEGLTCGWGIQVGAKNPQKSMAKNGLFSETFFQRFSSIFHGFSGLKINVFWTIFWLKSENVDFMKIELPPRREHDFSGFGGL